MTITGGTKLADDEIKRMMDDAEAHAEEDKKRREQVEARNQADGVIYQTEKSLKEHGDKLDEADRKLVEDALAEAKDALGGDDVDRIRHTSEQLMTASQKFAEVLYQKAQSGQGEPQAASSEGNAADGDVVDAEVVDEGDEESA